MNIIIIFTALFFDGLALIPLLGTLTNPCFGFILYLAYGLKSTDKNFGFKTGISAGIGWLANIIGDASVILFWLPTNLGQAITAIIMAKKKNEPLFA